MTKREIALEYLEIGLSVIPLKSPVIVNKSIKFKNTLQAEIVKNAALSEPRPEKEIENELFLRECKLPLVPWKEFQSRRPTTEEVSHWFNTNPDANIGIVTGAVSNLVVFDLDSQHAVEYAEEQGGFPDTVKVETGKGYHIYMRHPGFEIRNSVNRNIDIDIRADGGYVAAPPSTHGSGRQYNWVKGFSIFNIDPAACTPWMIDYLTEVSKINTAAAATKKKSMDSPSIAETIQEKVKNSKNDEYGDLLNNGCSQGERNHSATRLLGHLFATNLKENEIWEMIQMWNKNKVIPPLTSDELKNIFNSIKKNEQKSKEAKIIQIDSFLDNVNTIVNDYRCNYIRIPFANTNLINLEKALNGGFAGGRFYLFGGIPSAGKTALLNNVTDNICLNKYPVLFFSYDDGKAELRYRSISRFTKRNIEEFNNCKIEDIHSTCQSPSIKQIMQLKYVVEQMIPVEKWNDLIEQIKKKHGMPPVIVIDYLRKIRIEKNLSDERLRVDNILTQLTGIAKTYNTPVIAISELARDSYKSGQRLSLASFKESGTIEYEASWLGILASVEEGKNGEYVLKENWENIINQNGNIDLIIFKAKRGTGSTGKVPLKIDTNMMTVTDRFDEKPFVQQSVKNNKKTKY